MPGWDKCKCKRKGREGRQGAQRKYSAAGAEEVGEERARFFGEGAGGEFDAVVERGVVHDGEDAAAGPGLGVGSGVDQARDAGVQDGAGAHGAGLERAEERAVEQAVVGECDAGGAEGDDLGVGGGVVVAQNAVVGAGEDLAGG